MNAWYSSSECATVIRAAQVQDSDCDSCKSLQVVCATLTGVLGRNLEGKNGWFDVVYVDEAAQA